jgi:hypothetical protein
MSTPIFPAKGQAIRTVAYPLIGSFVLFLLLASFSGSAAEPGPPVYTVYRAGSSIQIDGRLDEPAWFGAPDAGDFHLPWWKSGKKERTTVKLLWDDQNLYIAHVDEDEFISARHREHDGKITEDDCFEIMIAPNPATPEVYFNIEWNVLGGYVDNFRPHGPKKPRAPVWDAKGIQIAASYVGTLNDPSDRDGYWLAEVKIPFASFPDIGARLPPQPGDRWNANFNRWSPNTNRLAQWSRGDTAEPNFHTPHRFGHLVFSAQSSPLWRELK